VTAALGKVRVTWMGYDVVQHFTHPAPYVVIAIATPGAAWPPLVSDHNRIEVLRLAFHDVRKPLDTLSMQTQGLVLYDEAMARQVVDFVARHAAARLVVCHCEAGISRSAGMAAALAELAGRSSQPMFRRAVPNPLVYGLTLYEGRSLRAHLRRGLFTVPGIHDAQS
jgi:predicted protein tyrosine phosphatase